MAQNALLGIPHCAQLNMLSKVHLWIQIYKKISPKDPAPAKSWSLAVFYQVTAMPDNAINAELQDTSRQNTVNFAFDIKLLKFTPRMSP